MGYLGNMDYTFTDNGYIAPSYFDKKLIDDINKACGTNLTIKDLKIYCKRLFKPAKIAFAGKCNKCTKLFTKENLIENVKKFLINKK